VAAFLRSASAGLIAALAANAVRYRANVFTITLSDGTTVFNWTDFDTDLKAGGVTYQSKAAFLSKPTWKVTNTMQVTDLTLRLLSFNTAFNGGGTLELQIHSGLLDGATLLMQRVHMGLDLTPDTLGLLPLFKGKIGAIDLDGVTATLSAKSKTNDLDQYAPRNLYRSTCNHAFCDPGCTLAKASYTAAFTVGASPTTTFIPWASAPGNATAYQNGTLVFTSGAASGSRRAIASASASGLTFAYPLPFLPAAGDTFTALQGCDKTFNSGSNQSCTAYSNTLHFRGFKDVPPPATSY
jgi:uncharacterized phage protein (TIGR02218 family)